MKFTKPLFAPHTSLVERAWYFALRALAVLTLLYLVLPVLAIVTLFLAGAEQTTLPRQMFTGIRENITPTIAALATILIVFSTCLLLALEWLRGRNAARAVA